MGMLNPYYWVDDHPPTTSNYMETITHCVVHSSNSITLSIILGLPPPENRVDGDNSSSSQQQRKPWHSGRITPHKGISKQRMTTSSLLSNLRPSIWPDLPLLEVQSSLWRGIQKTLHFAWFPSAIAEQTQTFWKIACCWLFSRNPLATYVEKRPPPGRSWRCACASESIWFSSRIASS